MILQVLANNIVNGYIIVTDGVVREYASASAISLVHSNLN